MVGVVYGKKLFQLLVEKLETPLKVEDVFCIGKKEPQEMGRHIFNDALPKRVVLLHGINVRGFGGVFKEACPVEC
jgi:hypothetical protein